MQPRNGVVLLTLDLRGLLAIAVKDWALPGNIEKAVNSQH